MGSTARAEQGEGKPVCCACRLCSLALWHPPVCGTGDFGGHCRQGVTRERSWLCPPVSPTTLRTSGVLPWKRLLESPTLAISTPSWRAVPGSGMRILMWRRLRCKRWENSSDARSSRCLCQSQRSKSLCAERSAPAHPKCCREFKGTRSLSCVLSSLGPEC